MPLRRGEPRARGLGSGAGRRYVLFSLGGSRYALEARHVRRAVPLPSDAGFEITLSGEAYPILDLRRLFRVPAPRTLGAALLLVESDDRRVALMVDAIANLVSIPPGDVVGLPPVFRGIERRWFAGVVPIQDRVVVVVRLEGILDTLDRARAAPPQAQAG